MSKELGQRIRAQRVTQGLSQHGLAQRAGVSDGYVSLVETGQRTPSVRALNAFASALNTTSDFLRDGGDAPVASATASPEPIRLARVAWDSGDPAAVKRLILELDLEGSTPADRFHALSLLGRARDNLGETAEAITVLERAYQLGQLVGTPRELAEVGMGLVAALVDSGALRKAVDVGDSIVTELASQPNMVGSDEHLRMGSTVVWAVFELGDFEHANFRANSLMRVADDLGSPWGRASVYWNAALIKHARGEDQEGTRLMQQTLDAMLGVGSKRDAPRVRLDYAIMLLNTSPPQPLVARTQLELAADGLRLYGTAGERARCAFAQARCSLMLGELQVAEDLATYGLVGLGSSTNLDSLEGHIVLGDLATRRGQTDAALQRYRRAGDQLAILDVSRRSGNSWAGLAQRLVSLGDAGRAVQAYNEALHALSVRPQSAGSEVSPTQADIGWGGRQLTTAV